MYSCKQKQSRADLKLLSVAGIISTHVILFPIYIYLLLHRILEEVSYRNELLQTST